MKIKWGGEAREGPTILDLGLPKILSDACFFLHVWLAGCATL